MKIKSEKSHARLDQSSRHTKAKKIISVLQKFIDLKECNVLDIGTGSGNIIADIAKHCKSAISVDMHDERQVKTGYTFKKVDNEKLPFKDNTFDAAISNHVFEHVPNQTLHLAEIHRVLKKHGILYLATPNKLWPLDPHYKLPFITWLPRKVSNAYLQAVKGKDWDIYSRTYYHLKKMAKGKFMIHNATLDIIKNPQKYNLEIYKGLQPIVSMMPRIVLRLLNPIVPTYILILRKI